jgi:hypothetical protein
MSTIPQVTREHAAAAVSFLVVWHNVDRTPTTMQRDFRDSELYIIRYQQCLTRSMTLVKMHFVTQIKLLGAEISRKMADRVSRFPLPDSLSPSPSL